jgi:hypothetical protein
MAAPHRPIPDARTPGRWGTDAIRAVAITAALLSGMAFALRVADEVPSVVTGVVRGARRVDSILELERRISASIPIPAYFPDSLRWPPARLLAFGDHSYALSFAHRQSNDVWLVFAATVGAGDVAPQLLRAALSLQVEPIVIGSQPGTAERLRDADGVVWHQITWQTAEPHGASRLVRYRGTLDEAMLIANSIEDRGR